MESLIIELERYRRQYEALLEGILDLEIYLRSSKFADTIHVNKADVLEKLQIAQKAAREVE